MSAVGKADMGPPQKSSRGARATSGVRRSQVLVVSPDYASTENATITNCPAGKIPTVGA